MGKILKITSSQFNMIFENRINKNTINEAFSDQTEALSANVSDGKIFLNFNIDDKDGKYIVSNIYEKLRKNIRTGKYYLQGYVNGKDAFLGGAVLSKIINFLSQKGYKVPTVDELKMQVDEKSKNPVIKDVITTQDKAEAKEKYNSLIVKILTNLKSTDMQQLMSDISQFRLNPDITDDAYGNKLSADNALRVLSAKPDATFVATRLQWMRLGRQVNPAAPKIILLGKSSSGNFDASRAEKSLGVSKDVAYQSNQMKHKFDIVAQSGDNNMPGFFNYVGYDISDTTLMPGSDGKLPNFDKFVDQPGLADNIKGLLNQAAIDMKGAKLSPEDKAKIGLRDTSNKNLEVFSRVLNYMRMDKDLKGVTDGLIKLDPQDDISVLKVIKEYYLNVAFDRASNDRELKTNIATAGILSMIEVAPVALAQIVNSNQNQILTLDVKDLVSVWGQIKNLERIIISSNVVDTSKAITNETENLNERSLNSVEDLMGLFGHTLDDLKDGGNDAMDNTDAIMNEFYNVYNKINNTINEYSNFRRKN